MQSPGGKLSITTCALPPGAATDGTDITNPVAMPAGGSGPRGWLSAIWTKLNGTLTVAFTAAQHVIVDSAPTTAVTGTFWPATQPVSGTVAVSNLPATQPVSGSVSVANFPATQPVSVATMPTTPVTGTFWQATQPVSLATNTPDITDRAARVLGVVTQQPVIKGTQGTNGVTTQDLKDAGRTAVVLSVTAVASLVAETMFTLNIWKAGTVTTATSYTVTAGKTFRIQAIQFGARFATPSTTVTFASSRFNVRSGNLVTSPLIYGDSKMAASNTPTPNSDLAIPDGLELAAGSVIGVSHVDSAATLLLDLLITGYEY